MISQQNSLIEDKRMLCCCKSNLKTLVILGLISFFGNIAFSAFELFQKDVIFLILGLFFAFNSGILIIGALIQSDKAILVWMILAIIQVNHFQRASLSTNLNRYSTQQFVKEFFFKLKETF